MDEPQELQELRDNPDPKVRARGAAELATRYQDQVNECSRIRKEALLELVDGGMSQPEIAVFLGMTRARVGQLLGNRIVRGERALLGTGALTIAVGGKSEGMRQNGSTMISAEASQAAGKVADLAESYGLKSTREEVDPPGIINLNRPNLIVLNSPRLLPMVGQVLGSDPNLGFDHGAQGWFLTEQAKDTIHRSPSDRGEPVDFAYIGRLPRPDRKGTFLYLAGIHAMGTLGAATYLVSHIVELYATVKTRRWSTLIECRYHPDTRQIESVERITEIYL